MFKRSKDQEKKGSEKREVLLVSFWKVARFVFAIIQAIRTQAFILKINANRKTLFYLKMSAIVFGLN